MILSYKAKNFYSIKDEIEIDCTSRIKNPNKKELYLDAPFDKKVSKIMFIGGANASGKTNIMRVLACFSVLVTKPISSNHKNRSLYFPFITQKDKPTTLSVQFTIDNEAIYEYTIKLNNKRIINEILKRTAIVNANKTTKNIFERKWNEKEQLYSFEEEGIDAFLNMPKDRIMDLLKNNPQVSVVSIFNNFDSDTGILRGINQYWSNLKWNILMLGNTETLLPLTKLSEDTLEYIYHDKKLRPKYEELLRQFDVGFGGIDKKKVLNENREKEEVYGFTHKYKNSTFSNSLLFESTGTQKVIILLKLVLSALLVPNGLAIIDEMDAYIHPDIFDELTTMFMDPIINTNNAQLILSGHNYSLLSKLDKQQIILCEKNEEGSTESFRLDEVEGVRADENFFVKYLSGVYGAKPNIGDVNV